MSALNKKEMGESAPNPIDSFERVLRARRMSYKRVDTDSVSLNIEGQHTPLTLDLFWNEEDEALHCACTMDIQLPEITRDLAAPVVIHINRRQWLGHFDITLDGVPSFRYTMLFHANAGTADVDVIEEMTEIATQTCDQYAPAFALMAASDDPEQFPLLFTKDGACAPLGLALLDAGGRG